jgi:hypothetical protein
MADPFVSNLPEYQAKVSEDYPDFVIVKCGRLDCPGTLAGRPFIVARREWLRPRRLINRSTGQTTIVHGRVCPYCSRAGRIPKSVKH